VSDAPGSPPASRLASPSWLDARLVLGVLLVLVSVLVGAKVLAGADRSQQVWSATHDLAPGTVLAAADVELTKVRLFGTSGRYLAGPAPVGYVVLRSVGSRELLPHDALTAPGARVQRRDVTVAVAYGHLPTDLRSGDVVDLYVTPDDKALRRGEKGVDLTVPRLVLSDVVVARVTRSSGLTSSGQTVPVVLTVDPGQVLAVVQALADGPVDLVRVPDAHLAPLATAAPVS
jgi:flagella basal body P-ring formation protein FlgA